MLDVHSTLVADQPGLLAAVDSSGGRCALRVSHDGGVYFQQFALPRGTLRRLPSPAAGGGAEVQCPPEPFAFATPAHGLAIVSTGRANLLYATGDGGASWRRLGPARFDATGGAVLTAAARLYAALSPNSLGGDSEVAISANGGRSWSTERLPLGGCSGISALLSELWVVCGSTIFHSPDAGGSWTQLRGPRAFAPLSVAAVGPGRAIATNGTYGEGAGTPPTQALWETDDGGLRWQQVWPALPIGPDAPPVRRWTGVMP
jgi:photosystem II stability/assembly factor-like uncharacterized protein